ncbi:YebC/PmpR family DNA-binding transcriptional regulator [Candidatus Microgenomates bacterium]|nr:YebC/PmpR family DNA-binding transcriptional regulator [Candidatus Microgenomates bacterium]
MSGHSKWAQIKRQKGTADVKRGLAFTKLANAITIAVRAGGGIADPESNFKLRLTIEKARTANMPKENIQRAIDRGKAPLRQGSAGLEEVVYEGFGPGGIAVIIECVTDNKERTRSEVRSIFDKNGGTLGQAGSVSYQFEKVGLITVGKNNQTFDEIFTIAVDHGAQDIEEAEEEVFIYTDTPALKQTKESLEKAGLAIIEAQLYRKPTVTIPVGDKELADKIISFVEKLENLDDVQKVYSNFDISNELLNG